ncbi:hypothetical protein CVT26_004104 [Gymnopilus dilepis]|uniref:Uncharacterized protein n=1 Tax=Gymnopilus dilepis TaxID=231916 RepID=A0A409WKV1_9AGAR|nr:hypothetical protein CVT26_004104 [Gymnopilus dilepis]
MLAPIAFVPIVLSYYTQHINCTISIILSCLSGTTSLALLITVILGVKVYRCMNNARFVPVILGLFQAASTVSVILDVISTQGMRRLSGDGSCTRNDNLRFTRYFVIIQFAESLFICCCFVYVCWKSRGSPAARGRISLELSMHELPIEIPDDPSEKPKSALRGWWDYVPKENQPQRIATIPQEPKKGSETTFKALLQTITGSTDRQGRVSSPVRHSKLRNKTKPAKAFDNGQTSGDPGRSRLSLAPSSMSRISRLVPRMELFQEVMKDELLYTTFITSTCVIVAVLAIIGVNFKNGLSVTGWIVLNWGIISLLAIHSFGRVVHRHERDALLQHPVTCTAIARTANDIVKKRSISTRRARIASISNETTSDDPFADSQAPGSEILERENPFHSEQDDDIRPVLRIPSPEFEVPQFVVVGDVQPREYPDFPTSDIGTPLVPVNNADFSRQQRFSRSWIVSATSNSNPKSCNALEFKPSVPPSAALSGKRIKARIKPQTRRLEIHIPIDTRPEVYNAEKSKGFGSGRQEDDREKDSQSNFKVQDNEEPRLVDVRLKSDEILHRGTHLLGVVRDGKLHLHPISETHQFRPTLTYLDVLSRKSKRSRGGEDESDSDEGPPPDPDEPTPVAAPKKEKKPAGEAKEVHASARKAEDQSGPGPGGLSTVRREILQIIRAEEEEKWENLNFNDVTTDNSSEAFEAIFSKSDDALECKSNMSTFIRSIKGL